ncbi:MAG: (2Fe-2S)-binding protein [Gammaproteobacteria bacterium]
MKLTCTVNGQAVAVDVAPTERLLDLLRGPLGLTGTKEGCGEGECGACAALVDGVLVNSCLVPVGQLQEARVQTIEGLPDNSQLAIAFAAAGAAQCGICTPGMILATTALLACNAQPSLDDIRTALNGNLCRCTGYSRIYAAVQNAAAAAREQRRVV